jgi:hypothetical protein
MKKLLLLSAGLLLLSACSHMPGTVKDVSWDRDGNLIVRKCDQRHNWAYLFLVWEETNCREEVKKVAR